MIIKLPEKQKSAKEFLLKLVPKLLAVVGVQAELSFLGIKINIQQEANKRIYALSEYSAARILTELKKELEEW